MSRLYGGIHFTNGDQAGRTLGRKVGAQVLLRPKKSTLVRQSLVTHRAVATRFQQVESQTAPYEAKAFFSRARACNLPLIIASGAAWLIASTAGCVIFRCTVIA